MDEHHTGIPFDNSFLSVRGLEEYEAVKRGPLVQESFVTPRGQVYSPINSTRAWNFLPGQLRQRPPKIPYIVLVRLGIEVLMFTSGEACRRSGSGVKI